MKSLTASLEDYLEVIYILKQQAKSVGITDIANSLEISKPSVNKAINILKKEGLVFHQKYGKIDFTEQGKDIAEEIYCRHKILSEFLEKVLGINSHTANIDACKIEHILSKETISKMQKYLEERK